MARTASLRIALIALVLLCVPFVRSASTASAAPYSTGPQLLVSTSAPAAGGTLSMSCSHVGANVQVSFYLNPGHILLGTAQSNGQGFVAGRFAMPYGYSGAHTITVVSPSGHVLATTAIMIGGVAAGAAGAAGAVPGLTGVPTGSNLAYTGVAVASIVGLGVLMLVGGGLLMYSGRTRCTARLAVVGVQ